MLDNDKKKILIEKACFARTHSYAPYSKYHVGCALLTKDGTIFTGCNVENSSYGLSLCSERTALFKAVSEGFQHFEALAVVTEDAGFPCGACRQVMNEFSPDILIIVSNHKATKVHVVYLKDLLPHAFGPHNLRG